MLISLISLISLLTLVGAGSNPPSCAGNQELVDGLCKDCIGDQELENGVCTDPKCLGDQKLVAGLCIDPCAGNQELVVCVKISSGSYNYITYTIGFAMAILL
jgi:hypothetical protein